MKQAVKKANPAKAVQNKAAEATKGQTQPKMPEIDTAKSQPLSRYLEAVCDCV